MVQQQKILRVFRLIKYLSQKPYKNKTQLAERLEVDIRSIERYFNLLEELGYFIDQDQGKRYFIQVEQYPAEKGVSFTFEESQLLQSLLQGERHNPLRDGIFRKLFISSELRPISQNLMQVDIAKKLRKLAQAINDKKCVLLKNYYSTNTQSVRDRLVEPLDFGDNYESITAYEPESDQQKTFRLDRIEAVEILDQKQLYKKASQGKDFFGFIGEKPFRVRLRMSDVPYRKLIEEFPATKPYTYLKYPGRKQAYVFEAEVRNEVGIGRFILGFPGEIKVESPGRLKNYLNERIKDVRY